MLRTARTLGRSWGLLYSLLALLREEGATHVGCATDHVIRSFRNRLYPGYKTEAGVPVELLGQFTLAERAMETLGLIVWPEVEFEADDALATAAARWATRNAVEQVLICTPDKDLAQCVRGDRVVLRDRRRRATIDAAGVRQKWGVSPESIPDYLALVGDSSDGYPGLPGWGAKSAAAVLARFEHLESIPKNVGAWDVDVRSAPSSARRCGRSGTRRCSTATWPGCAWTFHCRRSPPTNLRWRGARREPWAALCEELGVQALAERPAALAGLSAC